MIIVKTMRTTRTKLVYIFTGGKTHRPLGGQTPNINANHNILLRTYSVNRYHDLKNCVFHVDKTDHNTKKCA